MILDAFRLDGRVALVTGAGRGIGAATALALAEAGADVALAARTAAQLDEVAGKIRALGRRAVTVPCDLSDLSAVSAFAEQAAAELGRIDIVVNNVGGTMPNTFMTTSPEFLEEAFRFNVSTAHALTQAAVPHMLKNDGGSVVNISSMLGRTAGRGFLAYGTAKAALAHWTRLAATDLSPRVRVNAIAVGSVLTSALEVVAQQPEIKARMESATPLGRLGEPWEIAAAIVYLSSRAGGYITGKVIEVDGGIEHPNLELGIPDL
ncbi:SDR family oxidoreductase [Nocardia huaxiensis]|uniref:SDR family oxidoreductase n=1 Tax=Nocardia huaxiensis TaxID=2755382 RepID=A0A7D6ZB70_9NOCA|nr:SDR family oxidoreductase [Nocardia huaxiensis]QLY31388.1 SDR family oxidoreductase [Nocardia huaxiensis]UFS94934.1 SDR family oxidoreductase [Nocardia huaxiensis]